MPPCLARFSKVWLKFGDGKHRFLTEDICGYVCEEGEQRCKSCLAAKQAKTQDVRTFNHGLLNEDFTKESHMFDSPWFHAAIEKYGEPKAEDLKLAMETQRKARGAASISVSIQTAPVEIPKPVAVEPPMEAVAIAPVKLKAPKAKADKKPAADKKPKAAADGVKKPRAKKVTTLEVAPEASTPKAVEIIPGTVALVESSDEPLQVKDVIKVVLRPFTHGNAKYWRDEKRDKVYKRTPEGKRGVYVGRWDSDLQEINKDAPDSDEE
jgi:hypothetical protein